jgi:hypothetical protein
MRLLPIVALLTLLGGCATTTQVSSGGDYLAARPEYSAANGTELDKQVERAANVEPLLRFPAKLGLARISGGRFVPVPPREADAWIAFAQTHGQFGEFVPVSPLVGQMAAEAAGYPTPANPFGNVPSALREIRLGAARQHVDAVLVYTVAGSSTDQLSPLSVLDLTLIGAYLVPSRMIAGSAVASRLLFDVRNGYAYGTLSATSKQDGFVPTAGSGAQSQVLQVDAQVDAVGKLSGEADKMLTQLRADLQEKELKTLRAKAEAPAAKTAGKS